MLPTAQSLSSIKITRALRTHPKGQMPVTRDHMLRILRTDEPALARCTSVQIAAVLRLIDRAYTEGRAAAAHD